MEHVQAVLPNEKAQPKRQVTFASPTTSDSLQAEAESRAGVCADEVCAPLINARDEAVGAALGPQMIAEELPALSMPANEQLKACPVELSPLAALERFDALLAECASHLGSDQPNSSKGSSTAPALTVGEPLAGSLRAFGALLAADELESRAGPVANSMTSSPTTASKLLVADCAAVSNAASCASDPQESNATAVVLVESALVDVGGVTGVGGSPSAPEGLAEPSTAELKASAVEGQPAEHAPAQRVQGAEWMPVPAGVDPDNKELNENVGREAASPERPGGLEPAGKLRVMRRRLRTLRGLNGTTPTAESEEGAKDGVVV